MLRFDKAVTFSRILKSNLLVSLSTKTCGLGVLLFSEFIHCLEIEYLLFIILLYQLNYVIVYFFSDLLRLIQRINSLSNLN